MSGGSFNYLFHRDAEDLMSGYLGDLERMADEIADLGYAEDAAAAMAEVVVIVNSQRARLDSRLEALRPVMKAMEWWRSCDYSEDQFKAALNDWRNG